MFTALFVGLGVLLQHSVVCLLPEPQLSSSSLYISYTAGNDVVLRCHVKNINKRTVIWRKLSDPVPISVGITKFSPVKKYHVTHFQDSELWTLTIRNPTLWDSGEYQCQLTGEGNYFVTISLMMSGNTDTHIESKPNSVSVDYGETVILPCKVKHIKHHKVVWMDDKGDVLTYRKKVFSGNRRMRVIHTNREDWSLRIKRVCESDFGRYTCQVNTNPVLTHTVVLKNAGPTRRSPSMVKESFRKEVTAKEGDSVTLRCQFSGFPTPTISWQRRTVIDNRKFKMSYTTQGEELKLENVSPSDSGEYMCVAKNKIPPSARARITLSVEAVPTTTPLAPETTPPEPSTESEPKVYSEKPRVGQRKGKDVYLTCSAVADPRPSVYWIRNGVRLRNNFKYRTTSTTTGRYRTHSRLRILHVLNHDYGEYECVSHNNHGRKTMNVTLYQTFDN